MFDFCETPLARSAAVAFVINEDEEFVSKVNQSGRSNDGEGSRTVVLTGGLTTEIGPSAGRDDWSGNLYQPW